MRVSFFAVGVVLGAVGSVWAQTTTGARPPAVTPPPVAVKPAMERQAIRAQLLPRRYTTIAAEIGAKINQITVAEGNSFRAGQLLVSFDCSIQRAQLQKAQADLAGAQETHQVNQQLAKLNSVGQLELTLSKAAQSKATAEVGANRAVLAKCMIYAPFAGKVAEQKVRDQQFVQPGQALLDIIDDSVLELEFLVPSHWLAWIKPDGKFEVEIDETRKTYPAKFRRIGARIDPVSQSVKVSAAIDGSYPELMAGMSGKVKITPPPAR